MWWYFPVAIIVFDVLFITLMWLRPERPKAETQAQMMQRLMRQHTCDECRGHR